MSDSIGYITLRIPITLVRESESWEIPEEYTYLSAGEAELVSHSIPARFHQGLRDDLIECGIHPAQWDEADLAEKTTLKEEPPVLDHSAPLLLNLKSDSQ